MIGEPRFIQERLGPQHDRASFVCSREPALQNYLTDAGRGPRDNDRNISAVHVLLDTQAGRKIAGYFAVSNASVIPAAVPAQVAKKLPKYDSWGCVRLGRMARHDDYAGYEIGTILIARAFAAALSISETSGSFAMIVDAKNDTLVEWYSRLAFRPLLDSPRTLFITNATMAAYLQRLQDVGV